MSAVSSALKLQVCTMQNESEGQADDYEYQTYLSEGEGTASEEWRQDRSLNTESPRLHAALSGSLDSLRSSSGGGAVVRTRPNLTVAAHASCAHVPGCLCMFSPALKRGR